VLGDRHEHLADAPVGDPVGHRDAAAGLADAQQLGRGLLVFGGEHRAEDRDHHVEGTVAEGQVGGVALDELDLEPLGRGPLARPLDQRRDEVDPHRVAPGPPRRGEGAVAAAAGDASRTRSSATIRAASTSSSATILI
jgi:hypothetical protein